MLSLTINGLGFTSELETEPSSIRKIGAECGLLGFGFADFIYSEPGTAVVAVKGAQVGVCLSPRGVALDHGEGTQDLSTDTVIARTNGSVTLSRWTHGFRGKFFFFGPEAVERFFHEPLSRIEFEGTDIVEAASSRPVVAHLVAACSSAIEAGNPGGPLFSESLGAAALSTIVKMPAAKRSPSGLTGQQARLIRDLIHERSGGALSLVELAAVSNLSVGHMLRAFKVTFGMTPHQYIIRERIESAVRLIKTTTLDLDEVARCSGFVTRAQMTRTFRSVLGVLPKDFS